MQGSRGGMGSDLRGSGGGERSDLRGSGGGSDLRGSGGGVVRLVGIVRWVGWWCCCWTAGRVLEAVPALLIPVLALEYRHLLKVPE